jgi:hypothetical protein
MCNATMENDGTLVGADAGEEFFKSPKQFRKQRAGKLPRKVSMSHGEKANALKWLVIMKHSMEFENTAIAE